MGIIRRVLAKPGTTARRFKAIAIESRASRWVDRGQDFLNGGALKEALECSSKALSIYDDSNNAYHLMAEVLMPGDDYLVLLSRFHDLQPESYVEIGVATGETLALAKPDTKVVGIDPRPRIDRKIKSRARLYPIPSDEFFASYDLFTELGTSRVALVFIDGLHHFEQVLKDFINIERYADDGTVVLIHDCLPVARLIAARNPATSLWCGDVWKAIPCLKRYRPDLNVGVIPTRPSGLGIVTGLDPKSTVLRDNLDSIISEYQDKRLDYEYLDLEDHQMSNMVPSVLPNDWPRIREMVSRRSACV